MSIDEHLALVDRFYAAFGAEDAAKLDGVVTQGFRIEIPLMDHLPLEAVYEGTAGFTKLLEDRRRGRIEYGLFEVDDRVAQGDLVAVTGRTEGRALNEGRPFTHGWVHVFRFTNGRISTFKEYIDSSSVCNACCP